ncbi:MAG TPA: AAA family ATPase [Nitrosopumilus sp.]|nr:AAA family ATPase [Nitrosopumilus sp.]HJM79086.1 AAA family ATPase [Nitrosopumilus sp.]
MSIVITGNPGVGKHTITKEISQILNFPIIDINIIAKNSDVFEKNENIKDVDTQKLSNIFRRMKLDEKIIVGHLAPYVLEKNQVKIIIILRRNPYDLESVYKERNYSENKIKENAGSEILGVITHDTIEKFEEKAFQVDVSDKKIQDVVKKVLETISKKENNEQIDWLSLVTKNNDLEKFFTH